MAIFSNTKKPLLIAVNQKFIIAVVTGSLALAAYLVPQRAELVKRLMEDGNHERAIAVASESAHVIPSEIVQTRIQGEVVKELSPKEKLVAALAQSTSIGDGQSLATAVAQVADAKKALDIVHDLDASLTPEQREKVYIATGQSALAQGDPAFAASIFNEAATRGVRSESMLGLEVQAYRWSGQPREALAALLAWQTQSPLPANMEVEAVAVYRELNEPAKALEILQARLQKEKSQSGYQEATLVLASEVAANAGQMTSILPVVQDFLAGRPAGNATLAELSSGAVKPDETWTKFTQLCAEHCEWGGRPNEAFDFYQKLAVCGDRNALDRVLALNPGLKRAGDMMEVLRAVVPVKEKPELTRKLAYLLADAGEYQEADIQYVAWLKDNPKDIEAMKERAALAEEESRLTDALAIYRQALEIDPKNLPIQKEIASIQISQSDFRNAFEFYEKLPEKDHDNVTLENYALIAESLAEYPALNRAMVARHHRLKHPTAQDFLELARSFEVIGNREAVIKTYESGLAKIPRSRILHIELANTYRLMARYDDAITLLAKAELKRDMQAMQLFIEVACLKEDYVAALAFLGRGFESKFAFGPEVRLDLGHIYFNTGYLSEADALYSSVPDEPAMWPLLANARFKAGNFASAEEYQRKYLAGLKVPDPQGWMMMGDIYKASGREPEAQRAYAKSLSLMEEKIRNGTATEDDDPSTLENVIVPLPPITGEPKAASNH